jgi:cytochrome c oxidase assembly protein subunit 15
MIRLRRRELTVTAFRKLVYASVVWLYLVIVSGAVVRLTGSGLGCDNWPRCGKAPFPTEAASSHAIIEFTNRMVALGAIVFTLLAWLAARRTAGLPRWARRLSGFTFLGTVAQIPLGGVTVLTGLHPIAVMSHFLLALVVFGAAIALTLEARRVEVGAAPPLVPGIVRRLGLVLLAAATVLMVTGAVSTASGPHPGASNDVRRLFTVEGSVYVHVRATAVYGIVLAILIGALVWRRASAPRLLAFVLGLLLLLGGQMVVGEVQYRQGLPWWQVWIHVSLSAAVWGWTAWLVGALWRPSASLARPLGRPFARPAARPRAR